MIRAPYLRRRSWLALGRRAPSSGNDTRSCPHCPRWRNPHELLRTLAEVLPRQAVALADDAVASVEALAVQSATVTMDLDRLIAAIGSRPWAIVSNNSRHCIEDFVDDPLSKCPPWTIVGRPQDPRLMKPDPHLLITACADLSTDPRESVFIGDSVTDIVAGLEAQVITIGFANRATKERALTAAGAFATVRSLAEMIGRT